MILQLPRDFLYGRYYTAFVRRSLGVCKLKAACLPEYGCKKEEILFDLRSDPCHSFVDCVKTL